MTDETPRWWWSRARKARFQARKEAAERDAAEWARVRQQLSTVDYSRPRLVAAGYNGASALPAMRPRPSLPRPVSGSDDWPSLALAVSSFDGGSSSCDSSSSGGDGGGGSCD